MKLIIENDEKVKEQREIVEIYGEEITTVYIIDLNDHLVFIIVTTVLYIILF